MTIHTLRGEFERAERMTKRAFAAERRVAALLAVHEVYFDMDGEPGVDDTTPEPEDMWCYDRDFRAVMEDPS